MAEIDTTSKNFNSNFPSWIAVTVKSAKERRDIVVEDNKTIAQFKAIVAQEMNVAREQLCLVYNSCSLKDTITLKQCDIGEGSVVRVVVKTQVGESKQNETNMSANMGPSPFNLDAIGGLPGLVQMGFGSANFADVQRMMQKKLHSNPEMLKSLLDNPVVKDIMSNPDLYNQLIASNPFINEIMDGNPDLSKVLGNSDLMKQMMSLARKPALMKELIDPQYMDFICPKKDNKVDDDDIPSAKRQKLSINETEITKKEKCNDDVKVETFLDAKLENIDEADEEKDSQATENINEAGTQKPMDVAIKTSEEGDDDEIEGAGEMVDNVSVNQEKVVEGDGDDDNHENGGLLDVHRTVANDSHIINDNIHKVDEQNNLKINDNVEGLLGNGTENLLRQMINHSKDMANIMQTPYVQSAINFATNNPEYLRMMMNHIPGANNSDSIKKQLDLALPYFVQQLSNPEVLNLMSNPRALQAMLDVQEGMRELQKEVPGYFTSMSNTDDRKDSNVLTEVLSSVTNHLSDLPDEEKYATQLRHLYHMGFTDQEENLRVLSMAGGDINTAIIHFLQNQYHQQGEEYQQVGDGNYELHQQQQSHDMQQDNHLLLVEPTDVQDEHGAEMRDGDIGKVERLLLLEGEGLDAESGSSFAQPIKPEQ